MSAWIKANIGLFEGAFAQIDKDLSDIAWIQTHYDVAEEIIDELTMYGNPTKVKRPELYEGENGGDIVKYYFERLENANR